MEKNMKQRIGILLVLALVFSSFSGYADVTMVKAKDNTETKSVSATVDVEKALVNGTPAPASASQKLMGISDGQSLYDDSEEYEWRAYGIGLSDEEIEEIQKERERENGIAKEELTVEKLALPTPTAIYYGLETVVGPYQTDSGHGDLVWDLSVLENNYDPDKLSEQSFDLTAKIQLKEGISVDPAGSIFTAKLIIKAGVAKPVTTDLLEGNYAENKTVKLSTETTGATIYYTMDGSEPDEANGYKYAEGIEVNGIAGQSVSTTVKARAIKDGIKSVVSTFTYTIELPEPTLTPTPTPVITSEPTPVITSEPTPVITLEPTPVITSEPTPVITSEPTPVVTPTPTSVTKVKEGGDTPLKVRLITTNGDTQKLKWNKVEEADGYMIYYAPCSHKKNKIKTIKDNDITSFIKKNCEKNVFYKYQVKAYKNVKGKKKIVTTSLVCHGINATKTGKYTNVEKIKLKKDTLTMKKGDKLKFDSKNIVYKKELKGKKLASTEHCARIRYISGKKSVITVKKGKLIAVGKGTCNVYVVAPCGRSEKMKVTVK